MKTLITISVCALSLLIFGACSSYYPPSEQTNVASVSPQVEIQGKIETIDYKNRMVGIRTYDNQLVNLRVPQNLAYFDQLQIGSRVDSVYRQASVNIINPATTMDQSYQRAMASSSWTQTGSDSMMTMATVQDIDYDRRLITLQAKDGTIRTFHVPSSVAQFNNIRRGDRVVSQINEATAVSIGSSSAFAF